MILWLETLGVVAIAVAGGWLGRWFGRLSSRCWIAGYAVPLAVILPISLARRLQSLQMVPPFTWLMTGRLEFVLQAAAVAMLVLCLLPKLQARRLRLLLWLLMLIGVGGAIVPAFLLPAAYQ